MIENGRFAVVDDLLDDRVLVAIRIDIHHLTIAAARQGRLVVVSGRDRRLLWFLETDDKEEKDDD